MIFDLGPTIIEIESVVWPVPSDCIKKTTGETVTAYLDSEGKTDATVTQNIANWEAAMDAEAGGTFTIPPGQAHNIMATETHAASLHTYLDTQDATGASWDAISPCMSYDNDPGYAAFIARLETQLALAELWGQHPEIVQNSDSVAAGLAYEAIDWTRFEFTDTCCQVTPEATNATILSLAGLEWMNQAQVDVVVNNLFSRLDTSCCSVNNSTNITLGFFNVTTTAAVCQGEWTDGRARVRVRSTMGMCV